MARKEKDILRYWVPVLFWMLLIITVSSLPGEYIPKVHIIEVDKIVHFFEFFILGILLLRALLNSNLNINLVRIVILSIVIASGYAAIDEWHQQFIPNRMPDFFDFLADFIGLNTGVFLYKKRRKIAKDKVF